MRIVGLVNVSPLTSRRDVASERSLVYRYLALSFLIEVYNSGRPKRRSVAVYIGKYLRCLLSAEQLLVLVMPVGRGDTYGDRIVDILIH
jgi:hypothetical protein